MKIQRPGPDAPGGPRVEQSCEVCGFAFWPRAVDVEAGHGKRCQKRCELRSRCSACGKFACWGGSVETCKACRKLARDTARAAERFARSAAGRQQRIESGELRSVTLAEFRRISGRSLRPVDARARLGGAYDGKVVNLDHPDAQAFLATPKRPHEPRRRVPCACGCGRVAVVRHPGRSAQNFATLTCAGAAPRSVVIGGVAFTTREIVASTGRSATFVLKWMARGDVSRLLSPRPAATEPRSPSSR